MTRKADFNAEEWTTVVDGPLYAGMYVISASRGGTLRESIAMSRVYQEARAHHGENALLDEVITSAPTIEPERLGAHGENLPAVATAALRQAVSLIESKGDTADVDAYKRFVMTVAQTVAAAHKEGGFLGFGGTPVSEAEDAALDEISRALGTPPAS